MSPVSSCPTPLPSEVVGMLDGAGGRLTRRLIEAVFRRVFDGVNPDDDVLVDGLQHDGAVLKFPLGTGALSVTTDAYVVHPRFFPGGNIGTLAVTGTLNDLAMVGARPHAITVSFILEEGLALSELKRIAASMAEVAKDQGVRIAAGDTKVVERGHGDGVYVTTTAIGIRQSNVDWQPGRIQPGDAIVVSGDLGRHGIAVLAAREELPLEGLLNSDCRPLWPLVSGLLDAGSDVACLRDLTRGGLGTVLEELAIQSNMHFELDEASIPVSEPVRAACEILGLDPLFVANEGRFTAIVRENALGRVVEELVAAGAPGACRVGRVVRGRAEVALTTSFGTQRTLDSSGAGQLPRIC